MDFPFTKVAYASVDSFVAKVDQLIINPLIALLFGVALVYFLYGLLEFMMNQQNEEKKTSGKSHMLWGVIGLTIMMGVWTILNVVLNTLNVTGISPEEGRINLPPYSPPSPNNLNQ